MVKQRSNRLRKATHEYPSSPHICYALISTKNVTHNYHHASPHLRWLCSKFSPNYVTLKMLRLLLLYGQLRPNIFWHNGYKPGVSPHPALPSSIRPRPLSISARLSHRSRKAMGAGPFEAAVAGAIGTTEAASILSTLAAAAAAADARKSGAGRGQVRPSSAQGGRGGVGGVRGVGGGGAGRPSIREQMMAARRKLEEEKRAAAAAAGGEGAGEGVGGAAAMEGGGGFLVVS